MNPERIEQLSSKADYAHVRVWLREEDVDGAAVALLLQRLTGEAAMLLELWEVREPTLDKLRALGLTVNAGAEGKPRESLLCSVDPSELGDILSLLLSESFGLWWGVREQDVQKLSSNASENERVRALPPEGRFVVMSLYDNNVEIFARGVTDLELGAQLDEVMERLPAIEGPDS